MNAIDQLKSRVVAFRYGLESGEYVRSIIVENEAYICDLNAEEQLYEQGVNRLGVKIMDYQPYSPVTIAIKQIKGQPYDRVTLHDEGDFAASFYIEADNKQFEIKASDEKTAHLIRKYGRQILGLTKENIGEVIHEYILPDLREIAHKTILQ